MFVAMVIGSLALASVQAPAEPLTPTVLRCELRADPVGVDVAQPQLSWILQVPGNSRARRQDAYQILVASSRAKLSPTRSDLWNSGKVFSAQTTQILYLGRPVRSSERVFWRVRVWDERGRRSPWSALATWTAGVMHLADWHAKWIGAAPTPEAGPKDAQHGSASLILRRGFTVRPRLARAVLHVCGLGQYEASLNGAKVGDDLLAPGWTNYRRTCLYDSYDVTSAIHPGENALGILLGNGMYNVVTGRYTKFTGSFGPIKAIAQLDLIYADGSTETIGTGRDWRTIPGPITFSSPFGGEDFDARLEPMGWTKPDFDDRHWEQASETDGPGGILRGLSAAAPPIRAFEVLRPVATHRLRDGAAVYDLGQNAALMARIQVEGPPGSSVRIIPSELLNPDGSLDRRSVGWGPAYWQYTLRGGGPEVYASRFFSHGARYLEVDYAPATQGGAPPQLRSIAGIVIHSASEEIGHFACSNELFNRINTLILWAQKSNLMSLVTDCPHRERLGWLEQTHLNGPALRYNFDLQALFAKVTDDIADGQLANGFVPNIAPEYVVFGSGPNDVSNPFRNSPEWGSSYLLVPWQQYEFDGDLRILRKHYEGMKRYTDFLASQAKGGILDTGLGDWYDIGPNPPGYAQLTPKALTATAFLYTDTLIIARTAALLGKRDDADAYSAKAAAVRSAFNIHFLNPSTGDYSTGSQCANSVPYVMGLVEPEHRQTVLNAIVRNVSAKGLTAGDVGYRYLLQALAEGGRSDVIYAMNNQSTRPGYGYQLAHGATSLTEAWDARPESSQDHFMLGQIMEWFYRDLAGIQDDPEGPGFAKIVIRPTPCGGLTWVKATYRSVHGAISSAWRRQGAALTMEVSIPPNTSATVFVPCADRHSATEAFGETQPSRNGSAEFHLGSGHYRFRSVIGG